MKSCQECGTQRCEGRQLPDGSKGLYLQSRKMCSIWWDLISLTEKWENLDEFLVNPMTRIFFCQRPLPFGHGDGFAAAEHDRQAVQGGVDRFRYGPGVPSGVWCVEVWWRMMIKTYLVDGVQEQDQYYSIVVISSQHVHYLEVATPTLSIVVSSSCFQSLVFLRVMMTLLILLYIIYDKHDDTM